MLAENDPVLGGLVQSKPAGKRQDLTPNLRVRQRRAIADPPDAAHECAESGAMCQHQFIELSMCNHPECNI